MRPVARAVSESLFGFVVARMMDEEGHRGGPRASMGTGDGFPLDVLLLAVLIVLLVISVFTMRGLF
jgi:hypothetical protein